MAAELGHFALSLAMATSLTGAILLCWGKLASNSGSPSLIRSVALSILLPILVAAAALAWSFAAVDLSVATVAENAAIATPLGYRILAAIAAPQASSVAVAAAIAAAGAAEACLRPGAPADDARFVGTIAGIVCAVLGTAMLIDMPFRRAIPVPIDGRDLDPVLQSVPGAVARALALLAAAAASTALAAIVARRGARRDGGIAARVAWTAATAILALDLWTGAPFARSPWNAAGAPWGIVVTWFLFTVQLHLVGVAKAPSRPGWQLVATSIAAWGAALILAAPTSATWGAVAAGAALSAVAFGAGGDLAPRSGGARRPIGISAAGWRRLRAGATVGVAIGAIAGALNPTAAPGWIVAACLGTCGCALATIIANWTARLRLREAGLAGLGRRLAILWPRTHLRSLAHAVATVTVGSLLISIAGGGEFTVALAAGEHWRAGSQLLVLDAHEVSGGDNFTEDRLLLRLDGGRGGSAVAVRRYHPARAQTTRRTAVIASGFSLIAVTVLGPAAMPGGATAWALNVTHAPLGVVARLGVSLLAVTGLVLIAVAAVGRLRRPLDASVRT